MPSVRNLSAFEGTHRAIMILVLVHTTSLAFAEREQVLKILDSGSRPPEIGP
jgi:hypothetical protein